MKTLTTDQLVEIYFQRRDGKTFQEIGEALHVNQASANFAYNNLKRNWNPNKHLKGQKTTYKVALGQIRLRLMNEAKVKKQHAVDMKGQAVLVQPMQTETQTSTPTTHEEQLLDEFAMIDQAFTNFQNAVANFIEVAVEKQVAGAAKLKTELEAERKAHEHTKQRLESLVTALDEVRDSNLLGFLRKKFGNRPIVVNHEQ